MMRDERIPVRLAAALGAIEPGTLVLADRGHRFAGAPGVAVRVASFANAHERTADGAACACCAGRAPFATELGRLFAERARGEVVFFRRLLALGGERARDAASRALREDAFLAARYRLDA